MVLGKTPSEGVIARALGAFPEVGRARAAPLRGGLINLTYAVEGERGSFILQRLSAIFDPAIHHNIVAVTERLRARGLQTPVLLRASDGRPWADLGEDGIWRVMTRVSGVSHDTVQGPAQAWAAGGLVARFHSALADLSYTFQAVRQGVHDTPNHLRNLERALKDHPGHRLHGEVAALARELFAAIDALPAIGAQRSWVVHGDLKISNLLFAPGDPAQAVCLVDLDTVGRMPLWQELGDAWRSWCNPRGEDVSSASFDHAIFAASLAGYRDSLTVPLHAEERAALAAAPEWIALELTARFAADALNERYFGWDRGRFPAAGEHNLLRARGQLALARAAAKGRDERASLLV